MNYTIIQLRIKKQAYISAANLVNAMQEYSDNYDEKTKKILETHALFSDGMPLPSGRWGNAIALALEINDYVSALHLIENASKLELETDTIVSELGFNNPWGIKDEFLFSESTYEPYSISKESYSNEEDYKEYLLVEERNSNAFNQLREKLGITEEDENVLKLYM